MLKIPEGLATIFCYIGATTSCFLAIQVARHLFCYLRPSSLSRYNPPRKDAWALITGASDGIGFGFAQELSKRGFNIFLHGRNHTKLLRRQEELRAEFPNVKSKIIVFDAAKDTEDLGAIVQEIGDACLTVLVNNVGGERRQYEPLTEFTHQDAQSTLNLNATFMAHLTRVLLPILEQNGPGLILNMSSVVSYGMPLLAMYSGTKGFIDSFTRSIQAEMDLEGKDVEVLGLRVGSVQSQGNDVDVSMFIPTSRKLAAAALNRVGCGQPVVFAYWLHAIQGLSFTLLPRSIMLRVIAGEMQALKQELVDKEAKRR